MINYPAIRPASSGGGRPAASKPDGAGGVSASVPGAAPRNPDASRRLPRPRVAGSGRTLQEWSLHAR
jgi:hypothetical protein